MRRYRARLVLAVVAAETINFKLLPRYSCATFKTITIETDLTFIRQ